MNSDWRIKDNLGLRQANFHWYGNPATREDYLNAWLLSKGLETILKSYPGRRVNPTWSVYKEPGKVNPPASRVTLARR